MNRKQLKAKEVQKYRKRLLKKQKGVCSLCHRVIEQGQDTLDHCHDKGNVRAVLHRNCNSIEGRIKHWARRSGIDPSEFLEAVLEHWAGDYSHYPLHPNHRTDKQKEILRLKRRMRKLKTEKAKQRYRDKIKSLQGQL